MSESTRCICEWAHPVDGVIRADWPAEMDPECPVHGAPNDYPEFPGQWEERQPDTAELMPPVSQLYRYEDGTWCLRRKVGGEQLFGRVDRFRSVGELRAALEEEPDRKEGWRSRLARRLRAAAGPQGIEHMEMDDGAVLTQQDLEQAALTLEHCEEHHE